MLPHIFAEEITPVGAMRHFGQHIFWKILLATADLEAGSRSGDVCLHADWLDMINHGAKLSG